jgi:glutamate 5-kinase
MASQDFAVSVAQGAHRLVLKVGSSLVTNEGRGIDMDAVAQWAAQIAGLHAEGRQIVLVSSGAIAEGMARLGWPRRPGTMPELQAAAAVGQMGLIQAYESAFAHHGIRTAQILLTHEDLSHRRRYLNARSTLVTLLNLGVVPIVNENDTVVTDEIRLGDNDTLGALVTNLIEANVLVILTDQPGLYSADPRKHPDATFIHHGQAGDPALESMAGGSGSAIGTGGMLTKVLAARRAANSGGHTHWHGTASRSPGPVCAPTLAGQPFAAAGPRDPGCGRGARPHPGSPQPAAGWCDRGRGRIRPGRRGGLCR